VDNANMDLGEIGLGDVWINLAHDRNRGRAFVNTEAKIRFS
jgi:hypothetical protein